MNSHQSILRNTMAGVALGLVGVGVYSLYLPSAIGAPLCAISGLALLATLVVARRRLLPRTEGRNVLLIDGHCILCHGIVRHVLKHDTRGRFHFAHLQSDYGRATRRRHGADEDDIDSVYLVLAEGTPRERLLIDGAAGRHLWPSLYWPLTPLLLVPVFLLNPSYTLLGRFRYRLFGRYETCHVPSAEERKRFVTDAAGQTSPHAGVQVSGEALAS